MTLTTKLQTLSILALAACGNAGPNQHAVDVAHGQQLVTMGGCTDCHTPKTFDPALGMPVPDGKRFLSGHPEGAPDPQAQPGQTDMAVIGPTFTSFKTGFGVVYSRNLTPDKETGLGTWTPEQFIQTMRTGHRQGTGRVLLPPMPWMNLAKSSEEDLRAIFAYLQTLPAVHNQVPEPKVPAPAMAAIEQSYAKVPL